MCVFNCVCVHMCVFMCVCVRMCACVVCMCVQKIPEHDVFWATARKIFVESVFRELHPLFLPFLDPALEPFQFPPIHFLSAHHWAVSSLLSIFALTEKNPTSPLLNFSLLSQKKTKPAADDSDDDGTLGLCSLTHIHTVSHTYVLARCLSLSLSRTHTHIHTHTMLPHTGKH